MEVSFNFQELNISNVLYKEQMFSPFRVYLILQVVAILVRVPISRTARLDFCLSVSALISIFSLILTLTTLYHQSQKFNAPFLINQLCFIGVFPYLC